MFRTRNVFLLALIASTATALEPHLRVHDVEEDDLDIDMKAKFSMEKHVDCEGGCSKRKGMERTCEGGMKKEYSVGLSFKDISTHMASEMSHELSRILPTEAEAFMPPDDVAAEFEDSMEDTAEDGFSRSMEFGGSVKADWKCTVTYSKARGKFSKKIECDFSSTDGSGTMDELADNNA